jgi:hypothetical protein
MGASHVILAPEAAEDVLVAYAWYESRGVGLGEDFLYALDAAMDTICQHPEMYITVQDSYRRTLLRRFPYGVF